MVANRGQSARNVFVPPLTQFVVAVTVLSMMSVVFHEYSVSFVIGFKYSHMNFPDGSPADELMYFEKPTSGLTLHPAHSLILSPSVAFVKTPHDPPDSAPRSDIAS